jgi:hypothetical protein
MGRKALNKYQLRCWVNPENHEKLKSIAKSMGYTYSDEGSIGSLLDAIANQEIILIPAQKILGNNK